MSLFDKNLHIKTQALTLLNHMSDIEYDHLGMKDRYHFEITTSAFYNGRENGIGLEIERRIASKVKYNLCIYFGEHRSSDNIFVANWNMDRNKRDINPISLKDYPETAYKECKYFEYGAFVDGTTYICELIKAYVREVYKQQEEV